jgi:4-hydroxy-2-oxoheptanedioate aldolase
MLENPIKTQNSIKTKWQRGEAILNAWLSIPSSVSAEATARLGFDSVTIDMQHGLMHYDNALPMLQAINTTSIPGLARVPWNEPGIIMKMLDAGCLGIICPMISSREECEAFVKACRYPPQGYRSYGPTRANLYFGNTYAASANTNVLTFAMIETSGAMQNLEAIMSVPGLDAIYVGPADLSQALGGPPGADWEEGPVPPALDEILAVAKRNNIFAGIHTGSARYAKKMVDKGFQFVTVQSELAFLTTGGNQVVSEFRGATTSKAKGPY